MHIKNRKEIPKIQSDCEDIQELYNSKNLSVSYATIKERTKSHKHLSLEEVYYIIKGKAKMKLGEEISEIKEGDVVTIPKDTFHHIFA